MSPSKICFAIAAVCFLLTLLTVSLGSFNLTALGLLFIAVGLFL